MLQIVYGPKILVQKKNELKRMRGIKQNGTEKLVSSWVLKIKHLEKVQKSKFKNQQQKR